MLSLNDCDSWTVEVKLYFSVFQLLSLKSLSRPTSFAICLFHNPSFTWTISTPKLQVKALGTIFHNVSLSKDITLAAFNGLPWVTIGKFHLAGGTTIETQAVIPSPSQLGIDLGTVGFLAYYDNVEADSIDLVAKGGSVVPIGSTTPISWLSAAFKTLSLDVVLMGKKYKLTTTTETYAPLVGSNTTLATYQNPFGFSLQVIQSAVDMVIALPDNGTQIATLALATSDTVGGVSTGNVADLPISFHNLPLTALSDPAMQELFEAVTDTPLANLTLEGSANVTAKTTIGNVPIASIPFNVQSSLAPVTVADLVVAGGTPDHLLIAINTDLLNPSNITLETSLVIFALQFESVTIGSAIIDPLLLVPGNALYATQASIRKRPSKGLWPPAHTPSLQPALSPITLTPVTIPAIHQLLIPEATLEFTVNITQTGIANATFMLDNPFDTSINILMLSATATYQNLTPGSINNVDLLSHPIVAEAHQNITSPVVPFAFNLNPMVIIELKLDTAAANVVDLRPLVALFNVALSEPNFVTSITSYVDAGPAVGNQFDVYSTILAALKGLKINLAIESSLKLDEYPTNLGFNQTGVSVITDQTALYLIGAAAPPIVQNLVDEANLVFTGANPTNLTDTGFSLALAGSLTNIGPLDAFSEPVIVNWEGADFKHVYRVLKMRRKATSKKPIDQAPTNSPQQTVKVIQATPERRMTATEPPLSPNHIDEAVQAAGNEQPRRHLPLL
ncbi:hypothetical protein FIBSPDRAFT_951384 [Athelia psychrophila]|uniref:Uncharacterized protein n=1 Tax=Athelia psychrophila TaxID=1759441 RepID=A0A166MJV6_9AGAM|nr:hypothetical protein FIBSPDRAFT_951384 [Fibularhizoctonia sp. CBS 109695]